MAKRITLTPITKSPSITVSPPKIEEVTTTVAEFLLEQAKKEECQLYGIIDSARNEDVFRYLISGNATYQSLLEGTMDVHSFGASGFLVECKKDSLLFNWMTTEAWGDSCCIFFTSKSPFEELFIHLQQFNRVYIEDEDVVLFRYYDPRVLRVYLPTCNHNEIETFFGDIKTFFAEDKDPSEVITFSKASDSSGEVFKRTISKFSEEKLKKAQSKI